MKKLLVVLILLTTPTFALAEPISKAGARNYYENCAAKQDPNMSANTQKLLCACTAVQMHQKMTTQDVEAMTIQDARGRAATNKMILEVYAPCMKHPAGELSYKNCLGNPQTASITENPEKTCQCMSSKIANYLSTRGVDVFTKILNDNPNATDPMAALANDPNFQSFAQAQLVSCL
ncbi:MAG: hypothetical protein AAF244_03200 [Pseudomonadota bacterium]